MTTIHLVYRQDQYGGLELLMGIAVPTVKQAMEIAKHRTFAPILEMVDSDTLAPEFIRRLHVAKVHGLEEMAT